MKFILVAVINFVENKTRLVVVSSQFANKTCSQSKHTNTLSHTNTNTHKQIPILMLEIINKNINRKRWQAVDVCPDCNESNKYHYVDFQGFANMNIIYQLDQCST